MQERYTFPCKSHLSQASDQRASQSTRCPSNPYINTDLPWGLPHYISPYNLVKPKHINFTMSSSESFKAPHPQQRGDSHPHYHDTEQQRRETKPINDRRLMWKIDFHLVPALCLLYILAFLDRVNIANARLFSLEKDLNLTGNQYNICLVIFFIPYVLFEIPANYLLKKFRPSIWCTSPIPSCRLGLASCLLIELKRVIH